MYMQHILPVADPVAPVLRFIWPDPALTAATPAARRVTSLRTGGTIAGCKLFCEVPAVNLALKDSFELFGGLFIFK